MLALIKEAIASTAIEHGEGCKCTVCRAAAGDQAAFDDVVLAVLGGDLPPLGSRRVHRPE